VPKVKQWRYSYIREFRSKPSTQISLAQARQMLEEMSDYCKLRTPEVRLARKGENCYGAEAWADSDRWEIVIRKPEASLNDKVIIHEFTHLVSPPQSNGTRKRTVHGMDFRCVESNLWTRFQLKR